MAQPVEIRDYLLAWNPNTNRKFITLILANNKRVPVPVDSDQEFIAIAAVLNKKPVYVYPDGTIGGQDHIAWNNV